MIPHALGERVDAAIEARTAPVVDIRPGADEVAAWHLPEGTVARVWHPDGRGVVHEPRMSGVPFVATVPGDAERIGWGAAICTYISPSGLRSFRGPRDRKVWERVAKALEAEGSVVYVRHVERPQYSKTEWVAVDFREGSSDVR